MSLKYLLSNHRKFIQAGVSSFLLLLSFPPFNLWPVAFIAFVPFFFFLSKSNRREIFFFSYCAGIIFFGGSIYWISHVNLFGCIFLISFYAFFWALFGLVGNIILTYRGTTCRALTIGNMVSSSFGLACLWVTLELLRSDIPVFGFAWVILGFSQTYNLPFIQCANIIGAYGVSFFIIFINTLIYFSLKTFTYSKRIFLTCLLGIMLVFVILYSYGFIQLGQHPSGVSLKVGIIQGNIEQKDKWNPDLKDTIIEKYSKLIEFISYDAPDIIILPEACYPGNFERELSTSIWRETIQKKGIPIVLGAVRSETFDRGYNSSFFISPEGVITDHYDKIELVPFGEYIPWEPFFSFFGLTKVAYSLGVSNFQHGNDYTVFTFNLKARGDVSFATLICFEDIFPALARRFMAQGAQFLIVITNDAWFGDTAAPYQHLQASVFRAIENNCYVVRSANTGVSAFISPRGKVLNTVYDKFGNELFVTGGISRDLFISSSPTIYRKIGYIFVYLCLLFSIGYVVFLLYLSPNLFKLNKLYNK